MQYTTAPDFGECARNAAAGAAGRTRDEGDLSAQLLTWFSRCWHRRRTLRDMRRSRLRVQKNTSRAVIPMLVIRQVERPTAD